VGQSLVRSVTGKQTKADMSLLELGIAGSLSAIPTTAIMAPGERIKCLLQVESRAGGRKFSGPADVVRSLAREQGVASLFRGSLATLLRDGSGSFGYFALYEAVKRFGSAHGYDQSIAFTLVGGGLAGMINWVIALPSDTIKSRIQTAELSGRLPKGFIATGAEVIAEGGVAALYRGLGPALVRAFPANAACFFGMELSRSFLDRVL
jgi:solute carrier family 25 (mitochondrial carnitine/acylcarnitine transporter), member 20/29